MKAFLNHRLFFWAILALPAIPMIAGLLGGTANAHQLLHPTGEFAARFMIFAMMITPLQVLFSTSSWPLWLVQRRRALGVAAFVFAMAHTVFYLLDKESIATILGEFLLLGIWTGWLAFAIFIPLAATSNNAAQQKLGRAWKKLQRWVYLAAVATLLHWLFIHENLSMGAVAHFLPLVVLQVLRVAKKSKSSLA